MNELLKNLSARQVFRLASLENALKVGHPAAVSPIELAESVTRTAEVFYQYLLEADKKRGKYGPTPTQV